HADPPGGYRRRRRPGIFASTRRQRREILELSGAFEPTEKDRKLIEETPERRQGGKLVGEHLVPVRFKSGDQRRTVEVSRRRDGDVLGGALLRQRPADDLGIKTQVIAAEEVDDVIEVARPGSLGHGPDLLGE